MADTLTPEEKKRLTEELTRYANEGASDEDLRQFRDAFISELKKKGGGQPVSGQPQGQPGKPSAPSFGQKIVGEVTEIKQTPVEIPLRGKQKPPAPKKPYQDIYYKPEALPSETTQRVETPVIKAAKQDFKQTQMKPPVKPPVTEQGLKELEEKTSKVDRTLLKLQDYQTSVEDLDDLENLYDEDINTFLYKLSRRPDLYAKYSGRTEQETIEFFDAFNDPNRLRRDEAQAQYDAEKEAIYENYVRDYKDLKSKHAQITSDVNIITDPIIDDAVNEKTYRDFLAKREFTVMYGDETFGEVINIDEVDKLATEIADKYALPTDGEAWRLLKNKIKAKVNNERMKPKIEAELKKTNPVLLDIRQRAFEAGFNPDDIYTKTDSLLNSLIDQYEKDAKNEMDLATSQYVSVSKKLNQEYKQYNQEIERQQNLLNEKFRSGQIDQLEYESAFTKLEEDKKAYHAQYEKNYPNYDEYVKKANQINSRYERKFEIQKTLFLDKAQAELEAAYKKYAETYQEDPVILKQLENAYKLAYNNVIKREGETIKLGARISMNPLSSLYNSTMSSLGGVFKGWGGSLDSKSLELLGETMEQNFYMPAARTEDFSDWADPQNLAMITGNVLGSMGPSFVAGGATVIGTAYATGGLGLPTAIPAVISGVTGALAGWGAETIDIAGRAYLDVFEKSSGDVARANEAAKRSVKSQYDIMWLYSFESLPFIGKALKFIPTQAARIGVGAAVELGTEFSQEVRQGIFEENIVEFERDPWFNFDEAINDEKRRKQTLISIGPVALMGGAPQIGSQSIYQERRNAIIAQQQKSSLVNALPDQKRQYIQNMVFNKSGKFANSVIASLYASGKIDEKQSADLMLEVKRAEQIKEAGKTAGLSGSKLNIYGFYSARAEEAERNAGKFANDPILSKAYQDMAKQYRDAGVEFMNGGKPDMLTLTYADGSQAMMLPEDVNALFSDPIALSLLNNKSISIEAYNENGQGPKIIEELKGRAETYAKKNRYTQASEIASPMQTLRQNINQRIKELYAEQVELTEKQKREEAERITQEETAAFEQKEKERQQEERGQRDIEIERLQQQRMELGVNDVDAFFSDMRPLVLSTVERLEAGQNAPQSAIKVASDYLYAKYKELTAMKSDPSRMMTIAQIESIQAQIEQDLQTLAGNPPSQKTETSDQENIQGVSGEIGIGQEPITTQPIEVPSEEAAPTGGVLQTSDEAAQRVKDILNDIYFNVTGGRTGGLLDEGFANAPAALDRANAEGGNQYSAHGMAKTTIGKAFSDLFNLLTKGIDPTRGGGRLYTAPLSGSEAGAAVGTASGNAYMDGPFTLVANKGVNAITDVSQIGGIIVNDGLVDARPELLDALRQAFPNIVFESTSNTDLLVKQLNAKSESQQAAQAEAAPQAQEEVTPTTEAAPQTQEEVTPSRISEINNLEQALYENEVQQAETGVGTMSEQQVADVTARLEQMQSQNKEGGLNEVETLMKQALGEKIVTVADVDQMIEENKVQEKCPPKTKKAQNGIKTGFIPGGKWDVVKEFKGKSHAEGGIDIEIAGGKIRYTSKNPKIKAKDGGFFSMLKDIGYTGIDTALGTVGNVAGIKSMQDIIDEDQYANDKLDTASNFAGKMVGTALKVIPVTAPIASAVGAAGSVVNKVGQIDEKNYDPSKHTGKLDRAGDVISAVGGIASMAVGGGLSSGASKAMAAGQKLTTAQQMAMKMGDINKGLGVANKLVGGMMPGQNQSQFSNFGGQVVTINGVNYTRDQNGNLIPLM